MAIYYGKYVQIVTPGASPKFYISGQGSTLYIANWSASPVEIWTSYPTTVTNTAGSTGWMYLHEDWINSHGLFSTTDPKIPTALNGRYPIYYGLRGTVVGVKVKVAIQVDPNDAEKTIEKEFDLENDRAFLAPPTQSGGFGFTDLHARFGSAGQIGLSKDYIESVLNLHPDFDKLPKTVMPDLPTDDGGTDPNG